MKKDILKIGQIGIGIWGSNLLRNFSSLKNAKVLVCCDKDERKLFRVKSLYPHLEITKNAENIFKNPKLDAIVIATPPSTHGNLAKKALANKKHVFVEKPIALHIKDALKIVASAKKSNLVLMVGHLLLYHPAVLLLKRIIRSGELGKILYMYSTRVNLGQVRLEENALWSLAPHDVSVAMYLLGEVPIEVSTKGESYLQKNIEDVIFMSLKFKKQVFANTHVSWLDPHKIRKFTIVGTKKMAVFDDMEPRDKIKIYDKGVDKKIDYNYKSFFSIRHGRVRVPKAKHVEPLKLECQHFVNSVLKRRKPFTDGKNALTVLSVLEAAQTSLRKNGKPIKVKRV